MATEPSKATEAAADPTESPDPAGTDDQTASVSRSDARRVARLLGALLLVGLVAPFVVTAVPATVGADASYVVLSGSMEPSISPGDAVIVEDVPASAVERGDVVTFSTGEAVPTTHRVVEVVERDGERAFRTKGDANEEPDPGLVRAEDLRGELLFVIPLIGYVIRFGSTPQGQAVLVGVPVVLLVLAEAWSILRERDSAQTESAVESESVVEPDAVKIETATQSDDSDGEIELTTADLQASLVVLALLATYSTVVAVLQESYWSVAVAVGAGSLALLGVLLWYAAPRADETGSVRTAQLPDDETVAVESLSELLATAADAETTVYRTPGGDHFVVVDGRVFVHRGGDGG
jgi:signal peptidase